MTSAADSKTPNKKMTPVIISLVMMAVVQTLFTFFVVHDLVEKALSEKGAMLSRQLAFGLSEPLALGEYDHLQRLCDTSKKLAPDASWVLLVDMGGRALASTDPNQLNKVFAKSDADKHALEVKEYTVMPADESGFEVAVPVVSAGTHAGILRMRFSEESANTQATRVAITIAILNAVLAVITGAVVMMTLKKPAEAA